MTILKPPTIMVSLIMPSNLLPQRQTAIIRPEQHTIEGLENAMWSLFASKAFGTAFCARPNGPPLWVSRTQPTHTVAFAIRWSTQGLGQSVLKTDEEVTLGLDMMEGRGGQDLLVVTVTQV
jgi:hypothetical protein